MALIAPGLAVGAPAGTVEADAVQSPHLGRMLAYTVYLPSGAAAMKRRPPAGRLRAADGGDRRFPVLYLLHGLGDDETAWLGRGRVGETLDRLIAAGKLPSLIVVMPAAGRSWYVDDVRSGGAGSGPMFTAFHRDFVPAIDRRYPTLACRMGRAIGGLSMGGFGAVLAGVTYPDRFGAVISLSGSLFSPMRDDFWARRRFYSRIFGGVFGDPPAYDGFREWNVFTRLGALPADALLPAMFLSAGDDDFGSILTGTVRFHVALRRRGGTSQLRVIDGGHDWANWRGEIVLALQWLGRRIGLACPDTQQAGEPTAACRGAAC